MDTKLKKSKKIKAFLYRLVSAGLMFIILFAGAYALPECVKSAAGVPWLMAGHPAGLLEYTENFWDVFNNGILAYAGADKNQGFALRDADTVQADALASFHNAIKENQDNLIFCAFDDTGKLIESNFDSPLSTLSGKSLSLSSDVETYIYWNGDSWSYNTPWHTNPQNSYQPDAAQAASITFMLASVKNPETDRRSFVYTLGEEARFYQGLLWTFTCCLLLWFILKVMALVSRKSYKAARPDYAAFSLHIWLEGKLLIIAGIFFYLHDQITNYSWWVDTRNHQILHSQNVILLFLCSAGIFCLWTDFSANGEKVFRSSLCYRTFQYLRAFKNAVPWQRRYMIRSQILCFLSALTAGFLLFVSGYANLGPGWPSSLLAAMLIVCIALFLYSLRGQYLFFQENRLLAENLAHMRQGSLSALLCPRLTYLQKPFEDLNALEQGFETALEQKSKSERMRVELVTNVSHDLKTPLTSIMNYADLLCEEPLPSPAREYAISLQDKSHILKNMVQDVFELSKAATGNLPMEKRILDLCKLISQTLADMEEKIDRSGLTFKTVLPKEAVYIEGDGGKLYRVFQNLYQNALQYSLEHSRVHTQLTVSGSQVTVKIKNTSKSELLFDTEEITDRFVRADNSRTSEGSGLGLSIVQSFAEACGGEFHIETDADMFTAVLHFPLTDAGPEQVQAVTGEETDSTQSSSL